ncbi:MAG: virulence RhuM family protein [Candidatus Delongbacteria bacterium]|nr:virulence RhuM family protein [Candidatus Delongbacteria bacterium]MCG2760783.1 virulence RhuM family protein [Candidatus Delongbacteria bacterium]
MTLKEKNQAVQGEIIIYQPDEASSKLEVRIEDETVWLTQTQMSELFLTTRNNITLHISNIFNEKELIEESVCKDSLLTAKDGKKYKTKLYNLDIIISVGYRVKSLRGTQFRIWATKTLKNYLLKGYAMNQRFENLEKKVYEHDEQIEALVMKALPLKEGIFYDGQIFDAYEKVVSFIKSAKKSIVLIDNYIDESVLVLLSKRKKGVHAKIYTQNISEQLKLDLKKHSAQYAPIDVIKFDKSHDRFLIIDNITVYHIGASLKDLGKKWFAFSEIGLNAVEMIKKLQKGTK